MNCVFTISRGKFQADANIGVVLHYMYFVGLIQHKNTMLVSLDRLVSLKAEAL